MHHIHMHLTRTLKQTIAYCAIKQDALDICVPNAQILCYSLLLAARSVSGVILGSHRIRARHHTSFRLIRISQHLDEISPRDTERVVPKTTLRPRLPENLHPDSAIA